MTIWRDMAPELSLGLLLVLMAGAFLFTFFLSRLRGTLGGAIRGVSKPLLHASGCLLKCMPKPE